jgi:hypothetical protein
MCARRRYGGPLRATVTPSTDITWVRLRYRHLTQFEDYETAAMTFDAATRTYQGRIPASFIDAKELR